MKKSIIVIIAVAILGGGGILAKSHSSKTDPASVQGASTTSPASSQTTPPVSQTSPATSAGSSTPASSGYKDGTFTGAAEDTAYGTVQVAAVISGGKITDIQFLQMPGPEGHSKEVTAFSKGPLKASTLSKQTAKIDFVSGATQTSEGYQQSLQAALDQAS